MQEVGSRSGMRRLGACVFGLTIALIAVGVPSLVVCAGNELQQAHAAAGRIWYAKYCTGCHGEGGAPGPAVYRGSDRPVDLRTYMKRNNGIFPAVEWMAIVEHVDLSAPHAAVWEQIRTDQDGSTGQGALARGIVASIADYILSVQTK